MKQKLSLKYFSLLVIAGGFFCGLHFYTKKNSEVQSQINPSPKVQEMVTPYPFLEYNTWSYHNAPQNPTPAMNQSTLVNPFFDIKVYFSPTCGHCSQFFKDLHSKTDFMNTYITSNKVRIKMRVFPVHPTDISIALIASFKGEDHFIYYLRQFMESYDDWIDYLTAPKEPSPGPKKTSQEKIGPQKTDARTKSTALQKLIEKFPASEDIQKKINAYNDAATDRQNLSLMISPENSLSSVLVMALHFGFTPDEILEALLGDASENRAKRFIALKDEAKTGDNQPIAAVPAFYINDIFKGALTVDGIIQILNTNWGPYFKQNESAGHAQG